MEGRKEGVNKETVKADTAQSAGFSNGNHVNKSDMGPKHCASAEIRNFIYFTTCETPESLQGFISFQRNKK